MKKILILLAAACASQFICFSQESDRFTGRASVGADWKIVRGLHLGADYEIRSLGDFKGVERHQAGVSLSYKVNKWLRIGTGYTYIGHYNGEGFLKARHRIYADVTGSLNLGHFRMSLRERLQYTCKDYHVNEFQEPQNSLGLKSRLKLAYRGLRVLEPYAFAEVRNTFNDASYSAGHAQASGKYTDYSFGGYDFAYIDRVRFSVGLELHPARHHSVDVGFLADWNNDRELDVNSSGTKLKSVLWDNWWRFTPVVGYRFSF